MRTLVVYDSVFGNTEKVAYAVGEALAQGKEPSVVRVAEASGALLEGIDLLVVGSPTRGFRPTDPTKRFLGGLTVDDLAGVKTAAFDTRIDAHTIKSPLFRFIVERGGYAAKSIGARLKRLGAEPALPPEGFYVEGSEGPLREGELERAGRWAQQL